MRKIAIFLCGALLVACGVYTNKEEKPQVMVYISNKMIQCEYQGDTLETTANELIQSGIDVLESHCGVESGVAVLAVCGAGSFEINIHSINSKDLEAAEELGYRSVLKLKNEFDDGYGINECRT